jgi:hypothetical protein
MSEHLSAKQLDSYRERKMLPADLLKVDSHLAGCQDCRKQLIEPGKAGAALRKYLTAVEEPEHISLELMDLYVRKEADVFDRENVESHVEFCRRCKRELDDLLEFAAMMEADKEVVKIAAAPAIEDRPRQTFMERLLAFWRAHWLPLQLAMLALVILSTAWLARLPLQSQMRGSLQQKEQEIALQDQKIKELNDRLSAQNNNSGSNGSPKESDLIRLVGSLMKVPATILGLRVGPSRGGSNIDLISPVGTVVLTNRPELRWKSVPGATDYVVTIYDDSDPYNKQEKELSSPVQSWVVESPLKRAHTYTWSVAAYKDDQKLGEAMQKFIVLDRTKADELEEAKKRYTGSPDSQLILGILYTQAGLLDDAERELQSYQKANPKSAVVEKLLDNLRKQRNPGRS